VRKGSVKCFDKCCPAVRNHVYNGGSWAKFVMKHKMGRKDDGQLSHSGSLTHSRALSLCGICLLIALGSQRPSDLKTPQSGRVADDEFMEHLQPHTGAGWSLSLDNQLEMIIISFFPTSTPLLLETPCSVALTHSRPLCLTHICEEKLRPHTHPSATTTLLGGDEGNSPQPYQQLPSYQRKAGCLLDL